MEENKIKHPEVIDLRIVARKVWAGRRLFRKVLPVVFVVSCIYIFSLPRYYRSETRLAPEMENTGASGALSSLASSFGFDLSQMQTTDAITPLLYPDLLDDNGFVASLMDIKVESLDGEISTNYHDYLKLYQEKAWWVYPIDWIKKLIPKKKDLRGGGGGYDPYNLTKAEDDVLSLARENIEIVIDKKTGVVSIETEAQDPLICKSLADSVQAKLQVFITNYRTNKARTDYEYYKKLTQDAKAEYEKVRQQYGSLTDANSKVALPSVELKLQDMENDMQLKFNAYTTMSTQMEASKAKVQERTPAFTILKGAAVPVKPDGPKRILFVIGMLFLGIFGTIGYIIKDDILQPFKQA